jgi:cation diffusion facilitator CzcD-associated flavoprotein CzcO
MGEDASTDGLDYEAIVIGAGVCGIYQLHRLRELGISAILLEAGADLGGTWFWNRYPGARFDSESVSYAYSFSPELLQEWDWSERFSAQPDNYRYFDYVAAKFGLREQMRFDCRVEAAHWDDRAGHWQVRPADGPVLTCRFLITGIGLLSAPTLPRYPGLDSFQGRSTHTYDWPADLTDLAGQRVAVIGTGATGVQLISAIAPVVGDLTVFQRRPNWCAPLHNGPISAQEMADIKTRYDEIFAYCATTPGGFMHGPVPESYYDATPDERRALWEKLYAEPGFAIWLANYIEILTKEDANADFSAFIADKIRTRVDDPELAELLIPKDHGFGVQRVPMETNYYEAYNRPNVHLVDLQRSPIERITPAGIRTADGVEREFDIIVYATGFDAVTGAYDRIDIRGVDGQSLRDKWHDGPLTYLGITIAGFPNLIMPNGPQSGSGSTNFPRGIEMGVGWATELIQYMRERGYVRADPTPTAEQDWLEHVQQRYSKVLIRNAQGWFTGYNSNVPGHEKGRRRSVVYLGGTPRYRARIAEVAASDYAGITFA